MKPLIALATTFVSLNLFAMNTAPVKKSPVYGKADYGHSRVGPLATICQGRRSASQDDVKIKSSASSRGGAVLHESN